MTIDTIDNTSTTNTGFKYITNTVRWRDRGSDSYSYQVSVGGRKKEFSYDGSRPTSRTREQAFACALKYRNSMMR